MSGVPQHSCDIEAAGCVQFPAGPLHCDLIAVAYWNFPDASPTSGLRWPSSLWIEKMAASAKRDSRVQNSSHVMTKSEKGFRERLIESWRQTCHHESKCWRSTFGKCLFQVQKQDFNNCKMYCTSTYEFLETFSAVIMGSQLSSYVNIS